jgi:uncharacterized membrane protein YfcA
VGVGFAVAVLSAALGVAGGELRIPTLIYLFAYDAKAAGTLSLFASIPTVLAGAFGYRRAGHLPGAALKVAAIMGAGSVIGVLVGTSVLPHVHENLLRGLLGAILLLATVALAGPAFRRERRPA